jgi:hypothetical protein
LEEYRNGEFEGESKSISKRCNSLFQRRNSLFLQNTFPVPCRTGNHLQQAGIAAQIGVRTRWKVSKVPETSKFPVTFPVLSSPPGLPDLQGMKVGNNAPLNGI